MNYELFIAKRIIAGRQYKNSISSPIIKIAVTAIALGIIIMLISISISTGFQQKIRDKISGFKGHVIISNYDNNNSEISVIPIDIHQDFYPTFKDIDGIKKVQPFINKAGIIRTPKSFEGIVLKGVDSSYNHDFFKEYLVEGRLPNFVQDRNREILISESIAQKLEIHTGDTLQMLFSATKSKLKFKQRKPIVVGLYNTGFEKFDNVTVIGDIREVQYINKWKPNQVGGFEVIIDNFEEITKKGNEIYSKIGAKLDSQTIVDNYAIIFEWIHLFDNNVYFIIAIMIIVAIINMITALLVLILEKVQMIGILKGLGAQNKSIQKIFLYNASYLVIKGLIYGNIIGISLLLLQKFTKIIQLNPETYYVNSIPVHLSISNILILNIGTLVICMLVLVIPSLIISKINPSKSIKFS